MRKFLIIALLPLLFISCESKEDPVIEDLTLSFVSVDVTVTGGQDGSIDLTVSGGTSPYTFAWSNEETTEDLQNLAIGTYTVTVTSADGQEVSGSEVIEGPEIVIHSENISMGTGYASEIYYSLENGVVATSDRTSWDLGFYGDPRSSTIIINDGQGMVLYTYSNGDANDWASVDTVGMDWTPMFNNVADTTWQNGAFDRNSLGHPDYGWGVYSMTTHDVYGDSIYIVKCANGDFKKILIEKREAATNSFVFKYANIDGTDEQSVTLVMTDYPGKNMVYYSLINNTIIDKEPLSNSWDLVFTKYVTMIDNSGVMVPYIVTGALTKEGVMSAELHDADTASNDFRSAEFSKVISTIGSDWKSFNMEIFSYELEENLVYFVKSKDERYYKIVFTSFEGNSTGNISFVVTKL